MESEPGSGVSLQFLEQLRPFVGNDEAYGRIYGDFHDLVEISKWFLSTVAAHDGKTLSASELEDMLISIDIQFVEHAQFHLASLRTGIQLALENFPDEDDVPLGKR